MSPREASLTIRFSEDEMAEIDRAAAAQGRTRGATVRRLVAESLAASPPDTLIFKGLDGRVISRYAIGPDLDFVVDTVGDSLPMQIGQVEFRRGREDKS